MSDAPDDDWLPEGDIGSAGDAETIPTPEEAGFTSTYSKTNSYSKPSYSKPAFEDKPYSPTDKEEDFGEVNFTPTQFGGSKYSNDYGASKFKGKSKFKKPRAKIYDPELGEPPTEKQISRLKSRARNVAMYALEKSNKTRKQLKDKLYLKDIPADIIEEVLDELESKGVVNDYRLAKAFVSIRQDSTPIRTLKTKLRTMGVPSEIIDEVCSEIDDEGEADKARKIISVRTRSALRIPANKRSQKLVQFVMNKGFSYSVAQEVVAEFLETLEDDNEDDENYFEEED